jgi:hypothetical protein
MNRLKRQILATLFVVVIVGPTINDKLDTKNIKDIIMSAYYIPTHCIQYQKSTS